MLQQLILKRISTMNMQSPIKPGAFNIENAKVSKVPKGAGTLFGPGMRAINDAFREANRKAEDDRKLAFQRREQRKLHKDDFHS